MEKIKTSGATDHLVTVTLRLDSEKECIYSLRIVPKKKVNYENRFKKPM
jgi:hypothetical protein